MKYDSRLHQDTKYILSEYSVRLYWLAPEMLYNRPFYRYGGHIELIPFKEYYGMPRGHEHDPLYSHREPTFLFDCKVKLNKIENLTYFVLFLNLLLCEVKWKLFYDAKAMFKSTP